MASLKQFALIVLLALMYADVGGAHFLAAHQGRMRASGSLAQVQEPAKDSASGEEQKEIKVEKQVKKGAKVKKEKYPVIMALHKRLASVFAKSTDTWWKDWKIWVGFSLWVAVWVNWLIHGYDELNEVFYQRSLFVFGVNIMILHMLEYSSSIGFGMLVVCLILAAQNLFQNYLSFKHVSADYETPRADVFDCDTVYLDLSLPIEQIVVLFIAQCGVWWFFMTSILGNFDFSQVNYLFWAWAVLAIQMTMIFNRGEDSCLGNAFPVHQVYRLVLKTDNITFALADADGPKAELFTMSKANLIARGVMGFFCNSILREIMSYCIPLMLMGFSEPMDFVVYCVGVNFICTLDDMGEKKFELSSRSSD